MNGHLQDPRLNSKEQDFGILISSADSKTGSPRQIIYLKDEVSRFYTQGTPVTFELQTRKVTYDKPTVITSNKEKNYKAIDELLTKDLRLIEIEVATKVRAIGEAGSTRLEDGSFGASNLAFEEEELTAFELGLLELEDALTS